MVQQTVQYSSVLLHLLVRHNSVPFDRDCRVVALHTCYQHSADYSDYCLNSFKFNRNISDCLANVFTAIVSLQRSSPIGKPLVQGFAKHVRP